MAKGDRKLLSERIELEDSLEKINEIFYRRGWTDGLPIIPPTEERVARMLEYIDRDPQEIIAEIPPQYGEATPEKIAINAVMAGCLPPYLPLLITAVEAMVEEHFNLNGIQTTTHPCAPLIIVNGPLAKELEINSGFGLFGPGWISNATIGRAIRLILLNIGGAVAGETDKATQGQPGKYSYCIAENEEANPWEPLHVEKRFLPQVSTVTVVGGEGPHNINDHISRSAKGILTVAAATMAAMGSNNSCALGEPLLILSPEHAHIIAGDGWSKDDVKAFIFENARNPLYKLKIGGMYGMVKGSKWLEALDDHALFPVAEKKEDIMVMVAGGAGRHSCCVLTFGLTRSVTKPITLKDGTPVKTIQEFKATERY